MPTKAALLVTAFAAFPLTMLAQEQLKSGNFSDENINPFYCAIHSNGGLTINLQIDEHTVLITFIDHGKKLYEIKGHDRTVFTVADETLWYAEYSTSSSGGSIVSVDLATGREKWRQKLQGLPHRFHSIYHNLIDLQHEGKIVTAYGHESYGKYIEQLDAKTGGQISHVIVANDSPDNTSQP